MKNIALALGQIEEQRKTMSIALALGQIEEALSKLDAAVTALMNARNLLRNATQAQEVAVFEAPITAKEVERAEEEEG
jgi:hypothetical protein